MEYSIPIIMGLIAIYILITFRVLIDFEDFSFLNLMRNYEEWEKFNWFGVWRSSVYITY